jgi:hypothetical protein
MVGCECSAHGDIKSEHKIEVRRREERTLGRPAHKWQYNIKVILGIIGRKSVEWLRTGTVSGLLSTW